MSAAMTDPLTLAAAILFAAPPAATEVIAPDERVDRSRVVAGWRIEDVDEMDGGLMVRMTRSGRDYRLVWSTSYWRGNGGPVRGASFRWRDCDSGDSSTIEDPSI